MSNSISEPLFSELQGIPEGNLRHYHIVRLPEKEHIGRISIRTLANHGYEWEALGSPVEKGTIEPIQGVITPAELVPVLAWRKAQGEGA